MDLAIVENDNRIHNSKDILRDLSHRQIEMDLLKEMYEDLKEIPRSYDEGKLISDIIIDTGEKLGDANEMIKVKERIEYLNKHFRMIDLPQTHEDFAIRSAIFQVFRSLSEFIDISIDLNKINRL